MGAREHRCQDLNPTSLSHHLPQPNVPEVRLCGNGPSYSLLCSSGYIGIDDLPSF